MAWPTRVIPAPPISMRWVGPHSVTSWPNRRCQKSSSGKAISENAPQAAISTPPTGAYQPSRDAHRGRSGTLVDGQPDGQHAGGEDAEQTDEDEVVSGVGQRPRVAAVVDVQGDVPVHAEQRDDQGDHRDPEGQARPAGQAGDALAQGREATERAHAAPAVPDEEVEQDAGSDHGAHGGDGDLVEGGAASGFAGRGGGGDEAGEHGSFLPNEVSRSSLGITITWIDVTSQGVRLRL